MKLNGLRKGEFLIIATPNKNSLVGPNSEDQQNFDSQERKDSLERAGFQSEIYFLTGNPRVSAVHQRKKLLAFCCPLTGKLRRHIPWKIWDRFILRAGLSIENFSVSLNLNYNGIYLFALAQKKYNNIALKV